MSHIHRRLVSPPGLTDVLLSVCVSDLRDKTACGERWKVYEKHPPEHYGGFNKQRISRKKEQVR